MFDHNVITFTDENVVYGFFVAYLIIWQNNNNIDQA